MFIVDSHCDSIAFVAGKGRPLVNVHNFSSGYKQLQFVAMFCASREEGCEDAYQKTLTYIDAFERSLRDEADRIVRVKTYSDIEYAFANNKHAALLAVEGGSGIKGSLSVLKDFYDVGVRVFGLAWLSNELAKSNRLTEGEADTGLTDLGRKVVIAGNELGLIFDASHLSDKSFWDLMCLSRKPVIASHSNFRTLCGHSRNLTDEMAKAIVERDGMIGLNMYPPFINDDVSLQTVDGYFDHLDYCIDKFGADNVGFGGDIDGTSDEYPSPIVCTESIHDQFVTVMHRRGYSDDLIEKFAGGNYLNFLKKYL